MSDRERGRERGGWRERERERECVCVTEREVVLPECRFVLPRILQLRLQVVSLRVFRL